MRIFLLLLLLGTSAVQAQNIPIITQTDLYALLAKNDDTLRVVNFWATWCGPCVQELPHFEKLQRNHHDKPLKVILVSLDFTSQLQKRVVPFVKKRKLTSTVVLFDGGDPNQWIDRVEPRWSGSIPATLFLYKGKRIFYEGQLSEPELYQYIQKIKKQIP
jgi:thiol-disulfide isomerase/thioredoxin